MAFLRFDRRRETAALLLAIAAVGVVAMAWGFEFAGFRPCKLCLEQRIPYYVGAPLAFFAFLADRTGRPAWVARVALVLLAGLFVWGGSVGAYQAGAEWGWWPGPADCSGAAATAIPTSVGDLMAAMAKVNVVDCTKPQIRILGLSFAGWNVLASLGLIAVTLAAALTGFRTASAR